MTRPPNLPALVLASTSFRRQQLMRYLGLPYEIVEPDFDERSLAVTDFDTLDHFVEAMALGKGMSVVDKYVNSTVLSGDTMVEINGEIIGKPNDLDHARQILQKLSGRTHRIVTGVGIFHPQSAAPQIFSVTSNITFLPLSAADIDWYVGTSEPLGKAGAYAIQEQAARFVDHIEGSISSIVGFPIEEIAHRLEKLNYPVATGLEKRLSMLDKYY